MTYALVQQVLGQTISREGMEEASRIVPAVAVADCARLHRDLFGIVVRDLDRENALAFQHALAACGMETDLIPVSELPRLVPGRRGLGLQIESNALVETDLYGRAHSHPVSSWVFASAGRVLRSRERRETTYQTPAFSSSSRPRFGRGPVEVKTKTRWEDETVFRLDCFFARDPLRMEWMVNANGGMKLNGRLLRLKDGPAIEGLCADLRARLPSSRMNRGIQAEAFDDIPVYPNIRAYEEEIIWHFFRLRRT